MFKITPAQKLMIHKTSRILRKMSEYFNYFVSRIWKVRYYLQNNISKQVTLSKTFFKSETQLFFLKSLFSPIFHNSLNCKENAQNVRFWQNDFWKMRIFQNQVEIWFRKLFPGKLYRFWQDTELIWTSYSQNWRNSTPPPKNPFSGGGRLLSCANTLLASPW